MRERRVELLKNFQTCLMVSLRICTSQMQYECLIAAVGFSTTYYEDLHQWPILYMYMHTYSVES